MVHGTQTRSESRWFEPAKDTLDSVRIITKRHNGSYPPLLCRPVPDHQGIKEAWLGVKAFRGDVFSEDY